MILSRWEWVSLPLVDIRLGALGIERGVKRMGFGGFCLRYDNVIERSILGLSALVTGSWVIFRNYSLV